MPPKKTPAKPPQTPGRRPVTRSLGSVNIDVSIYLPDRTPSVAQNKPIAPTTTAIVQASPATSTGPAQAAQPQHPIFQTLQVTQPSIQGASDPPTASAPGNSQTSTAPFIFPDIPSVVAAQAQLASGATPKTQQTTQNTSTPASASASATSIDLSAIPEEDIPIESIEDKDPTPSPNPEDNDDDDDDNDENDRHVQASKPTRGYTKYIKSPSIRSFGGDAPHNIRTPSVESNPGKPTTAFPARNTRSPSHHSQAGSRDHVASPSPHPSRASAAGSPTRLLANSSAGSSESFSEGSPGRTPPHRSPTPFREPSPSGSPPRDEGAQVAGPFEPQRPHNFWMVFLEQVSAGLLHLESPQAAVAGAMGCILLILQVCSAGRICETGTWNPWKSFKIMDHMLSSTMDKYFWTYFCLLGANMLVILSVIDFVLGFGKVGRKVAHRQASESPDAPVTYLGRLASVWASLCDETTEPFLIPVVTFGLQTLSIFSSPRLFGDVSVPIRLFWINGAVHLAKWFLQTIEIVYGPWVREKFVETITYIREFARHQQLLGYLEWISSQVARLGRLLSWSLAFPVLLILALLAPDSVARTFLWSVSQLLAFLSFVLSENVSRFLRHDLSCLRLKRPFVFIFLWSLAFCAYRLHEDIISDDQDIAALYFHTDQKWLQRIWRGTFVRNREGMAEALAQSMGINMIKVTHKIVTKWVQPTNVATTS